jgi:16S rRNA (guanine(527)-N(7))-methyltransferase RsmG
VEHPTIASEAAERLKSYLRLLDRWNSRINLVGVASADTHWNRHVKDSLQLLPLIAAWDGPLVDLGSGAGFPGLVLAITQERETHLVDSDRRKAAFLQEAVRVLRLNHVRVHPKRIEVADISDAAIVTARALAPLEILITYAYRMLRDGGVALFPKGSSAHRELPAALQHWAATVEEFSSLCEPGATIFRLTHIRPLRHRPH